MKDATFLADFEAGNLSPDSFSHPDHVRAVWCVLNEHSLLEGLRRVRAGLRLLVESAGAHDKYNETITTALVLIIHERMVATPTSTWAEFEAANRDLLEWRDGALLTPYYEDGVLWSDLARRAFIPPDRATPAPHPTREARR